MGRSHDPRRLLAACDAPGIAAISHHSAAHLHGLFDAEPRLIHVVSVRGTHPAPPRDVIPHHTRALDPVDVMTIELPRPDDRAGRARSTVPVTTPAATVVMVAAYLDREGIDGIVARALRSGCTFSALQTAAVRRRRRGRCGPQRVLDALAPYADAEEAAPA